MLESFRAGIVDGTTVVDPTPSALPPPPSPFVIDLATNVRTPLPDSLVGGTDYWVSPRSRRRVREVLAATTTGSRSRASTALTCVRSPDPVATTSTQRHGHPMATAIAYQEHHGAAFGSCFVEDLATGDKSQIVDRAIVRPSRGGGCAERQPRRRARGLPTPTADSVTEGSTCGRSPVAGGTRRSSCRTLSRRCTSPTARRSRSSTATAPGLRRRHLRRRHPRRHDALHRHCRDEAVRTAACRPTGAASPTWTAQAFASSTLSTRESTEVTEGNAVAWIGDDRLIIVP